MKICYLNCVFRKSFAETAVKNTKYAIYHTDGGADNG